jgi:Holliday junction resolvase RusA-like endonuclease
MNTPKVADELDFLIEGLIVPKARPRRTNSGHVYMPQNYRDWMARQVANFRDAWGDRPPIESPVHVYLDLHGKHHRGSDADNLNGSVLDALQKAGVIKNDNLLWVPGQGSWLHYDPKQSPTANLKIQILDR